MGYVGMLAAAESIGELDVSIGPSERTAELNHQQKNQSTEEHTSRGSKPEAALSSPSPSKQERALKLFHTLMAAGFIAAAANGPALAIDISGAGATFPYPIYAKWADTYKKETGNGLNYQSIGSGGGIKQIQAKTVTFGATDKPLKADQLEKDGLVQWPMVMGAIVAVVNLEGVKPGDMVLDGQTLAEIYLGK